MASSSPSSRRRHTRSRALLACTYVRRVRRAQPVDTRCRRRRHPHARASLNFAPSSRQCLPLLPLRAAAERVFVVSAAAVAVYTHVVHARAQCDGEKEREREGVGITGGMEMVVVVTMFWRNGRNQTTLDVNTRQQRCWLNYFHAREAHFCACLRRPCVFTRERYVKETYFHANQTSREQNGRKNSTNFDDFRAIRKSMVENIAFQRMGQRRRNNNEKAYTKGKKMTRGGRRTMMMTTATTTNSDTRIVHDMAIT